MNEVALYEPEKTGDANINAKSKCAIKRLRTPSNYIKILTVLDKRFSVFGGIGLGALINPPVGFAGGDGPTLPLKVLRFWF